MKWAEVLRKPPRDAYLQHYKRTSNPAELLEKSPQRKRWEATERRRESMLVAGRRGDRIISLDQLVFLADARRSVICVHRLGHQPAAWVVSMQAREVHRLLLSGVYEYIPQGRQRRRKAKP